MAKGNTVEPRFGRDLTCDRNRPKYKTHVRKKLPNFKTIFRLDGTFLLEGVDLLRPRKNFLQWLLRIPQKRHAFLLSDILKNIHFLAVNLLIWRVS